MFFFLVCLNDSRGESKEVGKAVDRGNSGSVVSCVCLFIYLFILWWNLLFCGGNVSGGKEVK